MFTRVMSLTPLRLGAFALFAASTMFFPPFSVPALADSQIRIVRLSEVDGNVQFDNSSTQRYEKAFINLPITQGVKLRSQSDGRAEVEFEDGSTLRVVPDTIVEFPKLSLLESGEKVSMLQVKQGTAYINFSGAKDAKLTVTFGDQKLVFSQAAQVRLEMAETDAAVAVFKGDVQVQGPSGTVIVNKKQMGSFDLVDDRHKIAKNLEENPYDQWDKQQDQYHERYTAANYNSYSPYAYGTADLSYYGNFFNAPGYGMMWQPYFASAGWDPFMNGAWAFGPGVGYGWVSAYPWGWTPYHYGSWNYLPTYGWAWRPGSTWTGFNAVPRVANAPANFVVPQAPTTGRETVLVNRGTPAVAQNKSASKVVIRNNSAGLGIPRGGIKDPARVAEVVAERGTVAMKMHTVSAQPVYERSAASRGYAPSSVPSSRYGVPMQSAAPSSATSSSHSGAGAHR